MQAHPRPVLAAVAALVCVVVLAAGGSTAVAGGWAVGTLDAVPTAEPGDTVKVGFTVRQHGVTPVSLDGQLDGGLVGISLADESGTTTFFAAEPDGPVGHYVAEVVMPDDAGSYAWSLSMGIFGSQDLGELTVDVPTAAADGGIWPTLRWVLLALTAVLAVIAIAEFVAERRRHGAVELTPAESA